MQCFTQNHHFLTLVAAAGLSMIPPGAAIAHSKEQTPHATVYRGQMPVAPEGPFDRVFYPQNLPSKDDQKGFPSSWHSAYGNPQHNAAFKIGNDAPKWLRHGVTWNYAEARAWPLDRSKPFGETVNGKHSAAPVQTQYMGNALGVTAADGIVYGESDDMFAYAVNARTGQLIWRTSPLTNNLMGDPVVEGNTVYISAGSVAFNYGHVLKYAKNGVSARGEDVNYNGIVALNRKTGKFKWVFMTKGESMPTPAYGDHMLFTSTGAGNIFAIDADSGKEVWKTHVGGIANMSDPTYVNGRVYDSMSVKPYIYCLNAKTGKIIWKKKIHGAVNTGLGDVAPAVADGIVVDDTVAYRKENDGHKTVTTLIEAKSAKDGHRLWTKKMGRGPLPPAFKGGMPMIHDGVVYIGTPVNNVFQARNLKTGKLLWTWHVPNAGPAGDGRGPATFYQGTLYISTGPNVFALNPKTGKLIGQTHVGGRFGLINPAIVGGEIYLGNSWDWINAIPLSRVNPHYNG